MEQNPQTTIQQQFKAYPKNEYVAGDHSKLVKFIVRGNHLARQMDLNYEYLSYDYESMESNKLHTPLEKLKLVKSLDISLFEQQLENEMIFRNIAIKLKSLSFLQELTLQFSALNWVSIEGVMHLANGLAQMKLLKKLVLGVDSCWWIDDKRLHFIFRSLKKNNNNLQSLDLDLRYSTHITEKTFKLLASIFKLSLKSLKEFSLALSDLDFTRGSSLDLLTFGLTFLKELQKLRIDFSHIKVPRGMDFSSFMSSIELLTSLKELILDFASLNISLTALKDLANSLTYLTQLHTLSLSFPSSATFAEPEMEALVQCFQSLAPPLKDLSLSFMSSHNVNDEALEKLSAELKTLTNLSRIFLSCANCPKIGETGIANVTNGLVSLPNLHTAILGFRGCRPVKIKYDEILRTNKNIIILHFNYDLCNK